MSEPNVNLRQDRTPSSQAIVAKSVSKSFAVGRQQLEILHDVSLDVAQGEMVAIMGPSGSGESTLMYCLAGLEQPTDLLGGSFESGPDLGRWLVSMQLPHLQVEAGERVERSVTTR